MPPDRSTFANLLILIEKMPPKKTLLRIFFWLLLSGLSATLVMLGGMFLYLNPNLPDVEALKQVRLQSPLRVYSSDDKLIGEFGEQRRNPLAFEEIPPLFIKALLAAEDAEFYEHHGVSLKGLLRAGSQILKTGQIQSGGSTITMQLARDFFLTRRQVFTRKFNEILLSFQIEQQLTKEEIIALFTNKMFFGNHAYGLQAAAQIYYGKDAQDLNVAQFATIVGSLKAPSSYNAITNPQRALIRRDWILARMVELKFIDKATHDEAIKEPIETSYHGLSLDLYAPYVAEVARQEAINRFGNTAYSEGYKIFTTVNSEYQSAAQTAVINGLMDYDRRHGYRGPELRLEPSKDSDFKDWQNKLRHYPALGGMVAAAVIEVKEKAVTVLIANGSRIELGWDQGLSSARPYINEDSRGAAPTKASDFLHSGDLIRIRKDADDKWQLTQTPAVQATLVAMDPQDGAIRALIGGFDFRQSHFNRAVQGARQPGSSFKPFLYATALEHGFTPASIINDAPIVIENTETGVAWRPENDGGTFSGPMRMRTALFRSRNLVSIRLLRSLGIQTALDGMGRFGFDPARFPRDLTLALGTHELTPLQMATGYSTFANGGYKVDAHLITRIENDRGDVIYEHKVKRVCRECEKADLARKAFTPQVEEKLPDYTSYEESLALKDGDEPQIADPDAHDYAPRILDERVVYILDSMLKDVITKGTGRPARQLERSDIAGKTGTTNGPRDTWFAGYNPDMVAITWAGFDQNTLLGKREYSFSVALPIWIEFMRKALDGKSIKNPPQPDGVVTVRIDPETGHRAAPGDPDAIFEIFLAEDAPSAAPASGFDSPSREEVLPEELF